MSVIRESMVVRNLDGSAKTGDLVVSRVVAPAVGRSYSKSSIGDRLIIANGKQLVRLSLP